MDNDATGMTVNPSDMGVGADALPDRNIPSVT